MPSPVAPARGPRPLVGAVGALVGGFAIVVLTAGPAAAHAASGGQGGGVADARAAVVALAFAGLAAVAGPALSGSARTDRARDVVGRVAPVVAVALGTGIHLHRGVLVLAVAGAAATLVTSTRSRWRPLPAAVVLVAVTSGAGPGLDLWGRALGSVHVLAGASWLGLVAEMAVLWRRDPVAGRRDAMRLATPAIALVGAVAATGTLIAADHLGDARLALGSWWGRGLAAKVALVVVAAVVGALLRRGWAPRLEGSLLTGVAAIGLALAAVGGPLAGSVATGPLLVADDAAHASVVVAPLAPGENTVLVRQVAAGASGLLVDGHPVALRHRSDGLWAGRVRLAEGRHRFTVAGVTTGFSVQAPDGVTTLRATLPDRLGPDCLDRVAGFGAAAARLDRVGRGVHLQVGPGATCGLTGPGAGVAADAEAIDWAGATVRAIAALQARGHDGPITVVADGDPRAELTVRALRAVAPGLAVVDRAEDAAPAPDAVVLVATSRAAALATTEAVLRGGHPVVPVVLAPWLLDADLVAQLADDGLPALFATLRDPADAESVSYRVALAKAPGGGLRASAAGLEGYLQALAAATGTQVPSPDGGVFSMGRVAVLPASVEGHESEAGWARGVALVRAA